MRWKKTLHMVEAHAEGEVGRVVTGGIIDIPGKTMLEKMTYINEVDDSIRRFCVFEPRGYAQMSTNLLLPPTREDADAGFIILQGDQAHAMSGSNCICTTTVLLETGILPMQEPQTRVTFDMPAGLVTATADCKDGKCQRVELTMNPSFVHSLDVEVETESFGTLKVDVAFGGIFYALIDCKQLGIDITPENARKLVEIGSEVQRQLNRQQEIVHPENDQLKGISYAMLVDKTQDGKLVGATVLPPGRLDRSPCGTGNSARMAVMYARGEIEVGDAYSAYSVIGSRFDISFTGVTEVAGKTAVLPKVAGRGWIHGFHQIGVDPSDPYPQGFSLSDCWGEADDLLR
ncbi:proline racemase family protein [Thalassomonas viridans]|uniref:Proline racemase family protein n=2 Tax=Thalassomonas viridans TaxID=137584 RepID=A0AAE9Z6K1_9GAMM|nr:proline racemase family protein [Thalassomonas viridans]